MRNYSVKNISSRNNEEKGKGDSIEMVDHFSLVNRGVYIYLITYLYRRSSDERVEIKEKTTFGLQMKGVPNKGLVC